MEVRAGLFEMVIRKLHRQLPPDLFALLDAGVARLQALALPPDKGREYAEAVYRIHILCARRCRQPPAAADAHRPVAAEPALQPLA